ncbi:13937_t:CDS:2 [Ambispora leptoticha]|uniref:13937_t:CDS:1 n=1 Tax=Ambispora leptoticha TaxID=144679 RepID=A0A9N9CWP6_9GLOM|nr:13937_t:CDS:2 [Ambispora leptoticha]
MEISSQKLSHVSWMEKKEILKNILIRILDTLGKIWKNPAFSPKFAKTQSERTYVTDIIGRTVASKDRRGERGKRPDIMFIARHEERIYELIFAECSRIVCSDEKEDDDRVKLWRELNDGLYWANRGCRLDENEFGILGFQVAGRKFNLTRGSDKSSSTISSPPYDN